jgi:hypothetical protein
MHPLPDVELAELAPATTEASSQAVTARGLVDEAITELGADGTPFTAYGCLVVWRDQEFGVYRRFAEFRSLHDSLAPILPGLRFPLWPWPPPSWKLTTRPDVIEKRANALSLYLSQVVDACKDLDNLPLPLRRFLAKNDESSPGNVDISRRSYQSTGDFEEDTPELVLQTMQQHVASLLRLHPTLRDALAQNRNQVASISSEMSDEPYEDLESTEVLCERIASQLSSLENLCTSLSVQLMTDQLPVSPGPPQPMPQPRTDF